MSERNTVAHLMRSAPPETELDHGLLVAAEDTVHVVDPDTRNTTDYATLVDPVTTMTAGQHTVYGGTDSGALYDLGESSVQYDGWDDPVTALVRRDTASLDTELYVGVGDDVYATSPWGPSLVGHRSDTVTGLCVVAGTEYEAIGDTIEERGRFDTASVSCSTPVTAMTAVGDRLATGHTDRVRVATVTSPGAPKALSRRTDPVTDITAIDDRLYDVTADALYAGTRDAPGTEPLEILDGDLTAVTALPRERWTRYWHGRGEVRPDDS